LSDFGSSQKVCNSVFKKNVNLLQRKIKEEWEEREKRDKEEAERRKKEEQEKKSRQVNRVMHSPPCCGGWYAEYPL
jgi:Cft2 family RNA processing exonuclease